MFTKLVATGTRTAFAATLHVVSWVLYHLDREAWDAASSSAHHGT